MISIILDHSDWMNVPGVRMAVLICLSVFRFQGIFISDVEKQSTAYGRLSVKDKILDVDGVDFTKISLIDAETVLSNAGSVINIMVSRDK